MPHCWKSHVTAHLQFYTETPVYLNVCCNEIDLYCSGVKTIHSLRPEMVLLYSWENSLEKRELIWTCGGKKDVKNDLSQVTIISRDM